MRTSSGFIGSGRTQVKNKKIEKILKVKKVFTLKNTAFCTTFETTKESTFIFS